MRDTSAPEKAPEPVYTQPEPNAPVDMGEEEVEVAQGSDVWRGVARLSLDFVPTPCVSLKISYDPPAGPPLPVFLRSTRPMGFRFPRHAQLVEMQLTSRCERRHGSAAPQGEAAFRPARGALVLGDEGEQASKLVFHLVSFPDFMPPPDPGRPQFSRREERPPAAVLEADGWRISIWSLTDPFTRPKFWGRLWKTGYSMTHVGTAERADRSRFSAQEARGLLECLHFYLSFARAAWAGVALPVALDSNGQRLWSGLYISSAAPDSQICLSWFGGVYGEYLVGAFPGYYRLWQAPRWRDPLQKIIYWYVSAASGGSGLGVETGLILSQVALESLAWTFCVKQKKSVSASTFKGRGLTAADKFRLLASSLDLPLPIPTQLRALMTCLNGQPNKKWQDAMDAVTDIRNSLVHPGRSHSPSEDAYFEAWKLSLWYIELALLRLCEYNGRYANRLDYPPHLHAHPREEMDRVPWAKP